MKNILLTLCLLPSLLLANTDDKKSSNLSFFFDKPARIWEETLPLGNGRIGIMPDGDVDKEMFVLNEISLWSGQKQDTDNPAASQNLDKIRELLFSGKNKEAQNLMYSSFVCKGKGSNLGTGRNAEYGSYQILGNLYLDFKYKDSTAVVKDYKRVLDLDEAIARTTFTRGETRYTRDVFTSFFDDIAIIHLKAEGKEKLSFDVKMARQERFTVSSDREDLVLSGFMNNGQDEDGMAYAARIKVLLPKKGNLETSNQYLKVRDASEAILLVAMRTSHKDKKYLERVADDVNLASIKQYKSLLNNHTKAYQEKFKRVALNLGSNLEKENLPINERLDAYAKSKNDPSLLSLYFQFGRYLLISSTREGGLPPNLQGVWCNTYDTPWNGDYHLNINFQMNHWPAEVTNLSELHKPMIAWTRSQVKSGEKTAKAFYNSSGWVTHILGNVWEFTAPGEHPSWGATNTSAAWLCQHLYQHYQFNRDKTYLESVYPTMKGAAQFFVDMLVKDPRSGYLITTPTTSPENGYYDEAGNVVAVSAGSTMDNQIVRELFTNVAEAADALGIDTYFSQRIIQKRDSLMPTTVGKDGRIMEWLQEYKEAEPHHRHVSHLYGLYPGNEISITKTPKLAEAARKTLEARGDGGTGWSMAWKINFWARLHDGDRALSLLSNLLRPTYNKAGEVAYSGGGTYPNLFCAHPPFQIDGNLGSCAGITEMLMQSQNNEIELLPALPTSWAEGNVDGLKALGGFIVDMAWTNNKIVTTNVKSLYGGACKVRSSNPLKIKVGKEFIESEKDEQGGYLLRFATETNKNYTLLAL